MDAFKGKYERTSAENYEEFLKALDVSYLLRKAATVSTPVVEVTENSGVWSIKSSTTLKSMELKFKVIWKVLNWYWLLYTQIGVEFEESTPDGRDVKAIVNFEGGKIVTVQKAKKAGQKSTRSVREMNGPDELIYTMTVEGNDSLVCVQKFKRVWSTSYQGLYTDMDMYIDTSSALHILKQYKSHAQVTVFNQHIGSSCLANSNLPHCDHCNFSIYLILSCSPWGKHIKVKAIQLKI